MAENYYLIEKDEREFLTVHFNFDNENEIKKVKGFLVVFSGFLDYKFFVHKNVTTEDDDDEWRVSCERSGHFICDGTTKENALYKAYYKLHNKEKSEAIRILDVAYNRFNLIKKELKWDARAETK